jgi:bifunctional non-homologous end joining protein LigD
VSPDRVETDVDGTRVTVSNLDKVLYPEAGFTKGQVLDYYARVADVMLPHVRDRPATFKRYPNGVEGKAFFQKHAPDPRPDWVTTLEVPSTSDPAVSVEFVVVQDRATLVWAANLATLEFHVPLWHTRKGKEPPGAPDHMVFDLDPGPGTSIVECCQVARWIGDALGDDNVLAKTSGSKGLQLYVPLKRAQWDATNERAHELARSLESGHPDAVVSIMRKALRPGKVLVDWSQNSPSKTTVAAYSLRALATPTVSTPVTWDEIEACRRSGDPGDLRFDVTDVLDRLEKFGDLMADLVRPPAATRVTAQKSSPGRPRHPKEGRDVPQQHHRPEAGSST